MKKKIRKLDFESSEGPMRLVKVLQNHAKVSFILSWYEVHLKGGAVLATDNLHAFLGIRNGLETMIRGGDVRTGDRIWIDVEAFGADGSLYTTDKK